MTENEARTMWCPFAADSAETYGSFNRNADYETPRFPGSCHCLASACMAWRWDPRHQAELDGYCGLAGKP